MYILFVYTRKFLEKSVIFLYTILEFKYKKEAL